MRSMTVFPKCLQKRNSLSWCSPEPFFSAHCSVTKIYSMNLSSDQIHTGDTALDKIVERSLLAKSRSSFLYLSHSTLSFTS